VEDYIMRLEGRIALVTGSSRGIGKAIALRMAEEGAIIGINYVADPDGRNLKDAEDTAAEIAQLGSESIILQADVSNDTQVDEMVQTLFNKYGKIDILVNNAGIIRDVTLKKMTKQDWDAVIGVNLTGVFNCTRAVIDYMREAGYGRIVSISSISGQQGNIGQCNYAAAKAGIMGFTKSIAREGARKGITANAIAPGIIVTEMGMSIPEEFLNAFKQQIPIGKLGDPKDIANAAVFLASDESSYITGQVIHVNGGLYM
jgi:3-oxoacyl-[acyl-carrier protein] reductase